MIKCNVIADVADMRGKSVLVFLRPMRPARNMQVHAWQVLDLSAGATASFDIDTVISACVTTRSVAGNVTRSEPAVIRPGNLFQAVRPGGLSPKLEQCSDGMAAARLTSEQSGVYNQTLPPVPIDCRWMVGGSPVVTMTDVDWGMTCAFECELALYFMVTAPLLDGENFTVQAFTDTLPYTPSPDTSVLNVHITRERNRWLFDFQPDWADS